jgi:hypothetical protein
MHCTDHPPSCYRFQHSSIVPISGLLYEVRKECLAQRPCVSVTYCQRLNCFSDFHEIQFLAKICWMSFRKIGSLTVIYYLVVYWICAYAFHIYLLIWSSHFSRSMLNGVEQMLLQGKAFWSEGVNLILCIFEFSENSYKGKPFFYFGI